MPNQNGMGPSQGYDPAGGMGWGGGFTSGFGPTISTGGGGFGGLGGYPGFGGFGGFGGYGGMGGASNAVKGLPADYGSSTAGGAAAAGPVTGRTAGPAPATPGAGGGQSSGYPAPPDFSGGGMGFNPYGPSGGSSSAGGGAGGLPTMNIPGVGNVPVMSAGPATLTGPTAFPGTPGATPQSAGVTPGAGAGPAGGAGGLVGDLAGSYQNALNQSNQANAAQLGQVLGGFGGLQNNMLGVLGQTTNQQFQNVENQRQKDQAAATQNLIDRGLGNTTVGSSVSRGIQQDYQQNKNAITDQRLQQVLGILNQQGTGALNALYGFNQAGPDFNSLAALSQSVGASGQNPASGGGAAGGGGSSGGYQGPDLSGAYGALGNMLGGSAAGGGGLSGFLTGTPGASSSTAQQPEAQFSGGFSGAGPSQGVPPTGLTSSGTSGVSGLRQAQAQYGGLNSLPGSTYTPPSVGGINHFSGAQPGLPGAGTVSPGPVPAGPASSGEAVTPAGGAGGFAGSPIPNMNAGPMNPTSQQAYSGQYGSQFGIDPNAATNMVNSSGQVPTDIPDYRTWTQQQRRDWQTAQGAGGPGPEGVFIGSESGMGGGVMSTDLGPTGQPLWQQWGWTSPTGVNDPMPTGSAGGGAAAPSGQMGIGLQNPALQAYLQSIRSGVSGSK